MAKGTAKVQVDLRGLLRLRDHPEVVLRDLEHALHPVARRVLDFSAFLVPRGGAPDDPVDLADTGFLLGPVQHRDTLSVVWFAGYSHHAAAAIHEGFHWGAQTRAAPDFLYRAFKGAQARSRARKAVQQSLAATLRRLFPPQK